MTSFWDLEILRKDQQTWFCYLARDITQLISGLIRPIDRSTVWVRQVHREEPFNLLTVDGKVGQTRHQRCLRTGVSFPQTSFFTLPDFQPTTETPEVSDRVQLIGPEKKRVVLTNTRIPFSFNWETNCLIVGDDVFVFWWDEATKMVQLVYIKDPAPGPLEAPREIDVSTDGMLYLEVKQTIYQLNLLTLAVSRTFTPIYSFQPDDGQKGYAPWIRCLRAVPGGLVFNAFDTFFFFDGTAQQITQTFQLPDVFRVIPDPAGGTFYFQTRTQLLQLQPDGQIRVKVQQVPGGATLDITATGYLLVRTRGTASLYY